MYDLDIQNQGEPPLGSTALNAPTGTTGPVLTEDGRLLPLMVNFNSRAVANIFPHLAGQKEKLVDTTPTAYLSRRAGRGSFTGLEAMAAEGAGVVNASESLADALEQLTPLLTDKSNGQKNEITLVPGKIFDRNNGVVPATSQSLARTFATEFAGDQSTQKYLADMANGKFEGLGSDITIGAEYPAPIKPTKQQHPSRVLLQMPNAFIKSTAEKQLLAKIEHDTGTTIESLGLADAVACALQHSKQDPDTYKGQKTKIYVTRERVDFATLEPTARPTIGDIPLMVESTVGEPIRIYTGRTPEHAPLVVRVIATDLVPPVPTASAQSLLQH